MTFPSDPEHITVEWLSEILGAAHGDIEAVSVNFVGDAIGNTSDVYFIKPVLKQGVNLPDSLVAKMIPRFDGAIDVCKALKLFEREIEVYRNVAGPTSIRTPELIWSNYDPETSLGFMLLEDCSSCMSLDQTAAVPSTIEQLHRIVESAARLHASWFDVDAFPTGVLGPGHPIRTTFFEMVRDGWQSLLSGGPGAETIPESGRAMATQFTENLMTLVEERWPTSNVTVMHLDFRVDNMFIDPENDEPVIFDWQGASVGKGAWDLAYLLSTGYEPAFRREHEDALLQHYHNALCEQGVTGYSLDEIRADYRFGLAFSLWVVPFTAILDLSSERGKALTDKVIGGIFTAIEDHRADEAFSEHLRGGRTS